MARRYLLQCGNCDQKIPVQTTQAGQTIVCSGCKTEVKIGTLRDIQALAAAETDSTSRTVVRKSTKMSGTSRVVFVGSFILVAIALVWGLMSMTKTSDLVKIPLEARLSEEKVKRLEAALESVSPLAMSKRWNEVDDEAVAEWVEDPSLIIQRKIKKYRMFCWIAVGLVGAGVLGITASLLLPKTTN